MPDSNTWPTLDEISDAVIGDRQAIPGPFGPRPLIYADYVASGRALAPVEDAIRENVLPFYGNTHTETSYTGRTITRLREAGRDAIRKAVGADDDHAVIFAGNGATGAVDKLVRGLAQHPATKGPLCPLVLIGPYEHHSNDLPWRESGFEVVRIGLDAAGGISLDELAAALAEKGGDRLVIGAFSAASNVTGVCSDMRALARLIHGAGGYLVCDLAAGGPYLPIAMRESAEGAGDRIDAAFFSPHKFVGGAGASGVLVADRGLLPQEKPTITGGGTVSYVTRATHTYVKDCVAREEAGTPAIIANIRAGLVFEIKSRIGADAITEREHRHMRRLEERLRAIPEISIMGPSKAPRIGIYSFNIRAGERLIHHNFVVALLNDLFGIQARGGCSCAGPYGHELLGIGAGRAKAHERAVSRGLSAFRPGWARLGVNYVFPDEVVDYIAEAMALVARRGADLLALYDLDVKAGVWRCRQKPAQSADEVSFDTLMMPGSVGAAPSFAECLAAAESLADAARSAPAPAPVTFDAEAEALRWFWMPHEVPAIAGRKSA